eukprot:269313-Prymnesium_polylepis.1
MPAGVSAGFRSPLIELARRNAQSDALVIRDLPVCRWRAVSSLLVGLSSTNFLLSAIRRMHNAPIMQTSMQNSGTPAEMPLTKPIHTVPAPLNISAWGSLAYSSSNSRPERMTRAVVKAAGMTNRAAISTF